MVRRIRPEAPRVTNSGDAPKSLDSRFPVLNFPNITHLTANDKDFSLALEMTMRAKRYQNSAALLIFMRRTSTPNSSLLTGE